MCLSVWPQVTEVHSVCEFHPTVHLQFVHFPLFMLYLSQRLLKREHMQNFVHRDLSLSIATPTCPLPDTMDLS